MPGLDLGKPAMRAVGYRQIWRHLDGETGLEAMREAALSATWQLVRRQMTWLRAWPGLIRAEGSVTDIADETLRRVPQSA